MSEYARGYCEGFHDRDKQADRFREQIESMKCCWNCGHFIDNQPGMFTDFSYCEECTRNPSDQYPDVIDNWQQKDPTVFS